MVGLSNNEWPVRCMLKHVYAAIKYTPSLVARTPIILRKSKDCDYYRIVGPTYVPDFSCGQAILVDHAPGSSFVDAFDNPYLNFEGEDSQGKKCDSHF